MYKIVNYEQKAGFFSSQVKIDGEFEEYLNSMDKDGWALVAMTQLDTTGKNFVFKLVFKKK